MKGWKETRLGEVLEKTPTINPLDSPTREFQYIDVSSVSNTTFSIESSERIKGRNAPSRARKHVRAGDVLFATIRPTLKRIAIVGDDLDNQVCSTAYFVFRPLPIVSNRFLFYWLQSDSFTERMAALQKGASYPAVTDSDIRTQPFAYPPIDEQQRIVAILDQAFEAIDIAKANAEGNALNSKNVFQNYLRGVFGNPGNDWIVSTIGETCSLKSGNTVSPKLERASGDLPYLKVADMTYEGNDEEVVTSSRFLRSEDVSDSAVFPVGTTIFPKRGGAILTNKKRITRVRICADLNIMGVIPGKHIAPRFIYYFFLNVDMRELGGGSSIPQINNHDVAPLEITFPSSRSSQISIVSRLDKLREESSVLGRIYESKSAALDRLRASVLHDAFSGNLAA